MKSETAEMPKRQTKNSAGYDFYMPYDLTLKRGWLRRKWYTIDTGVSFDGREKVWMHAILPTLQSNVSVIRDVQLASWVMKLYPRSGLGTKYKMRFANTTGIIDQDYRGHIMACVSVDKTCVLHKGDRFMQGVIVPCGILEDEETPVKERGTGGHGSTGQ